MVSDESKICTICKCRKLLNEYPVQKHRPDGRHTWCRACYNKSKRAHYLANREREIARSAAYNRQNPERVAANMRRCRERRPEHFRTYMRDYREKNPEMYKVADKNKRAKRRAAASATVNKLTEEQWLGILKDQNNKCFYCAKKMKEPQAEHKVPLCRGGDHSAENIVASCKTCNCQKHRATDLEYAKRKGRLFW